MTLSDIEEIAPERFKDSGQFKLLVKEALEEMSDERMKSLFKEAITELADEKAKEFGWWSAKTLFYVSIAAILLVSLYVNGWHK